MNNLDRALITVLLAIILVVIVANKNAIIEIRKDLEVIREGLGIAKIEKTNLQ